MKAYLDQMIALRDRAASRAEALGAPNARSLWLRKRVGEDYRYEEIAPFPIIKELQPRIESVEGLSSLSGTVQSFEVSGVSRRYSREQLAGDGVDFVVGGRLNREGKLVEGVICRIDTLNESPTTWDISLRQYISEQTFY